MRGYPQFSFLAFVKICFSSIVISRAKIIVGTVLKRSNISSSNGPFAASGHMVQNPPCWRASCPLGHPEQSDFIKTNLHFLCCGCPSAELALQHGGFCTMWPLAAKGPFNVIFTTLYISYEFSKFSFKLLIMQAGEKWRVGLAQCVSRLVAFDVLSNECEQTTKTIRDHWMLIGVSVFGRRAIQAFLALKHSSLL